MTGAAPAAVSKEVARELFTKMALELAVDERLRRGIASGEFQCAIWPSRGQEAIAAGIGAALRSDDRLVTTYRGLHDIIGKGVPPVEVIGEVLARTLGASGGKGGTMHITAPAQGLMLDTGIVGAGIPVAVGLALAARQQGVDRVAAVTFGDGATNTGSFHEGINLAATWRLPVIFVCQNNKYAEMTPIEDTMSIDEVRKRALAFDIPGIRVDGNDPEAVYAVVAEAADRGRAGGGPTFIEAVTFRLSGHFFGDNHRYMPKDELEEAKEHDPIPRYRQRLLDAGLFTADELETISAQAVAEIDEAVAQALAGGFPDETALDKDFYADMEGIPA
jgi:pyruvate dehydrogenase E1 component alpha subunit